LRTLLSRRHAAGEVISYQLEPGPIDKRFPFRYVYIGLFDAGAHVTPESLDKILPKLILRAADDGVQSLFIPSMGTTWDKRQELRVGDFYSSFFTTLPQSPRPSRIFLSLYKRWPSLEIEEGVRSINRGWATAFSGGKQRSALVNHNIRTVLLFTALCMFSSSRRVTMNIKNFLIIALSFGALAVAVNAAIKVATAAYPAAELPSSLLILFVAALVYPFVATWSAKDVFGAPPP